MALMDIVAASVGGAIWEIRRVARAEVWMRVVAAPSSLSASAVESETLERADFIRVERLERPELRRRAGGVSTAMSTRGAVPAPGTALMRRLRGDDPVPGEASCG